MASPKYFDALIVGAGFAGIYQLKTLLDLGLDAKVIDIAGDIGGTWYWNRYPGAMSDTESYIYRFSWDHEDLLEYPWSSHYLYQPDIIKYLNHVVERYDLRKHMQFKTELLAAEWSESENRWVVKLSTNEVFKPRYLVTALGLLSKTNWPDIANLHSFQGKLCHTANWPDNLDLKGKRVGVIGNGSTGVQVITALGQAGEVKQLLSFQRSPQYSVPSGQGPVSPEYRKQVNGHYKDIFEQVKGSLVGFGFDESTKEVMSVSPEERERIFEDAWQKGNGFRFMFWTFGDITINEEANKAASDFIKKKIRETVKDPEKAEKLCPTQLYARRPLCDAGYYHQFNRNNVDIIDIKANPITEVTHKGIKLADGTIHELDVIVCATGFDAVDGNYTRIAIKGRNGETLKDHWANTGPTSYLGVAVSNFPNLFMITGPNGPFSNIPPAIETHVEFITKIIAKAESKSTANGSGTNGASYTATDGSANDIVVEAEAEAEKGWTKLCDDMSAGSLFRKTDSWIFGANVKGKKNAVMFYFGGLGPYRNIVKEVIDDGYRGFKPF